VAIQAWPCVLRHGRSTVGTSGRARSVTESTDERTNSNATVIGYTLHTAAPSNTPSNHQFQVPSPSSTADLHHLARILIDLPRLRPLNRRFTRASGLAPVDVVFALGRRVLDKHPFQHVVALRAAQEIVHVRAFAAVAGFWRRRALGHGKTAAVAVFVFVFVVGHELGEKAQELHAVARSVVCAVCVSGIQLTRGLQER
jgi:hypothetical protein